MRHVTELADEDLLSLAADGDAAAFGAIYDRHAAIAYALAYRITGHRAGAEDALQDAFLTIWRTSARYEPQRGSVRTWLLVVVRNRAIDHVRRSVVRDRPLVCDEGLAERVAAKELTDVEAVRREAAAEVRAALAALPPEQSIVIELAYFGGFTHTEIAEIVDAPTGTIKSRMRLGLDKLRDRLEPFAP